MPEKANEDMHGEKAGGRWEGRGRKWPRKREIAGDGHVSARNLGLVSLKDMKSTGVGNKFHGRSGGDNEGKRMECGRRKEWSPAGNRRWST